MKTQIKDLEKLTHWECADLLKDFIKNRKGKKITDSVIKDFNKIINTIRPYNFKDYNDVALSNYRYDTLSNKSKALDILKKGSTKLENGGYIKIKNITFIASYADNSYRITTDNNNQYNISEEDYEILINILN